MKLISQVFILDKPHTYTKNHAEITFDDFEFKGEYKDIKKDGSISKKEPIVSLDFYSLKKVETAKRENKQVYYERNRNNKR